MKPYSLSTAANPASASAGFVLVFVEAVSCCHPAKAGGRIGEFAAWAIEANAMIRASSLAENRMYNAGIDTSSLLDTRCKLHDSDLALWHAALGCGSAQSQHGLSSLICRVSLLRDLSIAFLTRLTLRGATAEGGCATK